MRRFLDVQSENEKPRDVFDKPALLYYTENRPLPACFTCQRQGGADHTSARWPDGSTLWSRTPFPHFATEPCFRPCRPHGTKADGIPTTLVQRDIRGNGGWQSRKDKLRILARMMNNEKPKKGRSTGDIVRLEDLPKRCFISHSYKDTAAMKKLRRSLPDDVELVTFPRAEPNPRQAVSNEIIPKILDCPGLVYLTGGASSKSFWVSFERDYALRSGRDVFAYNPTNGSFRRDHSPPIRLALTVMFHQSDEDHVRRLTSWMARERHFKLDESDLRSTFGGFTGDILVAMEELLINGGVVLWLMGAGSTKIADAFYSDEFVDYLLEEAESDSLEDGWQDFLARQHDQDGDNDGSYDGEDEYYNEEDGSHYSKRDFIEDLYLNVDQVIARIDPHLPSDWRLLPWGALEIIAESGTVDLGPEYRMIDLYDGTGGEDFNWNRVDDLIIALYARLLPRNKDPGGH
jgi:hypothetical protein